jgi:hypothetical protein
MSNRFHHDVRPLYATSLLVSCKYRIPLQKHQNHDLQAEKPIMTDCHSLLGPNLIQQEHFSSPEKILQAPSHQGLHRVGHAFQNCSAKASKGQQQDKECNLPLQEAPGGLVYIL